MLDSPSPVNSPGSWPHACLVALIALAAMTGCDRKQGQNPAVTETKSGPPVAPFTDVTKTSGITFIHNNGAYGEKLLPESMGGGVAFLDFDNDGQPDLLFINSTYWPGHLTSGAPPSSMALFHNDGQGRFTDVTAGSGLNVSFYGMGVAVGDFDNDGFEDVFITGVGTNKLFHNVGGKFIDITAESGLGRASTNWSTSAAWIDYDNDGDLDLFVCNYVQWSREIDLQVDYKLAGIGRAYGPPMNFTGSFCALYRNDGNGRFTDVSATSGVQVKNKATGAPVGKSLGVAPVDIDGDGWIDLIVANDTVQNFVFHNERNGTFKEMGAISGIGLDSYGTARGAMGIDSGHFQDENTLGISIGNFANEGTALYVSQANPLLFSDEAIHQGIGGATRVYLTFGVFFFDYDLDGWLDLLVANGHIEPEINKLMPAQRYAQPAQLFWNARAERNQGAFILVSPEKCGNDLSKPIVGRGSAYADIDGDGDLDVVLTQINGPPLLLRNDQRLNHHWIRLKLAGKKTNRSAIGAKVRVKVGGKTFSQQVMPTKGYLSQSELTLTFGMGGNERIEDAEVIWPGGAKQSLNNLQVDKVNVIEER